ncbi:NAD(P)H-dependent flavin oxidoreductase [Acetobacter sp. AAB5]|uniref:NAD(P)H-dependent flavin oxidoreductase n=1 Tax=Acetobacter sp. AAB5 TaxID=3418370 RepID=UPI003CF7A55F
MLHHTLAETLELALPVIQAPMAGISNAEMVIAASNAGFLGSLGAGMMSPEEIEASLHQIKSETTSAFNVNLFIIDHLPRYHPAPQDTLFLRHIYEKLELDFTLPNQYAPSFQEQFEVLLHAKPPVASFTFGILTQEQVSRLHAQGIFVCGTATTSAEARAWADVGADAVCAQGIEAGGHRGSFLSDGGNGVGLLPLVREIVKDISIPVIAAGGIMDGEGIVAAISLGAEAVQMGTAFLGCSDTALAPAYRKALAQHLPAESTVLTHVFSGRLARGIRNQFIEEYGSSQPFPYPVQNALTQALRKKAARDGNAENMSLWAGQGLRLIRDNSFKEMAHILQDEIRLAVEKVNIALSVAMRCGRSGS